MGMNWTLYPICIIILFEKIIYLDNWSKMEAWAYVFNATSSPQDHSFWIDSINIKTRKM